MKSFQILILASVYTVNSVVYCHMMMNHPSVWGYFDASMETPLNQGTQNWFCHGKQKGDQQPLELNPGGSVSFKVTCGEAGKNGDGRACANDPNALHKGGGCAISIDYSGKGENFKTISVAHECPSSSYEPISKCSDAM